jgi:hypothetical protein
MCETAPTPATTSAPRKPRARRWWSLALVVILALVPLHWLLFQGQEAVPGVITCPLGPCWKRLRTHQPASKRGIKMVLSRIDFANGDVLDFFKHLAGALAL